MDDDTADSRDDIDPSWYSRVIGFHGDLAEQGEALIRSLDEDPRSDRLILAVGGVKAKCKDHDIDAATLMVESEALRLVGSTDPAESFTVALRDVKAAREGILSDYAVKLRTASHGKVKLTCRTLGSMWTLLAVLRVGVKGEGPQAMSDARAEQMHMSREMLTGNLRHFVVQHRYKVDTAAFVLSQSLDGYRIRTSEVSHYLRIDRELADLAPDAVARELAEAIADPSRHTEAARTDRTTTTAGSPGRSAKPGTAGGRVIGEFYALATAGYQLSEGDSVEMVVDDDGVKLRPRTGRDKFGPAVRIPFGDVTAVEIGGPGEEIVPGQVRGGGFVGGGIGVGGFLLGATAAAALNKLTTRVTDPIVTITTLLRITTRRGELNLLSDTLTLAELDIELSAIRVGISRQRVPAPATAPAVESDPIERLERLAKLRDQGVLTEQEFTRQKRRILDQN